MGEHCLPLLANRNEQRHGRRRQFVQKLHKKRTTTMKIRDHSLLNVRDKTTCFRRTDACQLLDQNVCSSISNALLCLQHSTSINAIVIPCIDHKNGCWMHKAEQCGRQISIRHHTVPATGFGLSGTPVNFFNTFFIFYVEIFGRWLATISSDVRRKRSVSGHKGQTVSPKTLHTSLFHLAPSTTSQDRTCR